VRYPLEPDLARKLEDVGLDPADPGDASVAWHRLHENFGPRATLLDRYALEAAQRGLRPEALSADERRRLTLEVLTVRTPSREVVAGSHRVASDPIEVVPYDERWPALFAEWRDTLRSALGDAALRIDHIGSTSVPGLEAKAVIDIQVSVRDIEEEGSYVPAIQTLGVALRLREPGHRFFRPPGDRPRTVQIHVYQAGSAPERDHLLFRDFLRADPEARGAYARMKREVALRYRDDRIAYNEAKTAFILDQMERAGEWALRTMWDLASPTFDVTFHAISGEPGIVPAMTEYQELWAAHGDAIVERLAAATGLRFPEEHVSALIHEGPSRSHPLTLRASYDRETKLGTLIHELAHRLIVSARRDRPSVPSSSLDAHELIDLFLFDVWSDLYGEAFARRQVEVESQRRPVYAAAWRSALAVDRRMRAARLRDLLASGPVLGPR
jgi:GrpB-like predicted nucleotidyltransferase (UPF0157 family)